MDFRTHAILRQMENTPKGKRNAFANAFIEACERKEQKDAEKRRSLARMEARNAKVEAKAPVEAE